MRIISWNINSVRLRLASLKKLIETVNPDIICLQETKVINELFPEEAIKDMGYPFLRFKGMKGYNGVAILSRIPLHINDLSRNWCEKEDCRHLALQFTQYNKTFTLHNFYIPAGGDEPDPDINPKFAHKLQFLGEVTHWFENQSDPYSILVGDFNIAPLEHDVWSHKQLLKIVSHTPIECEKLIKWQNTKFVDAMRIIIPPTEKLYTWWSYRNKDWQKSNRGRRLDHLWITPDLKNYLKDISVYKAARNWEQPSDHVPIILDLVDPELKEHC